MGINEKKYHQNTCKVSLKDKIFLRSRKNPPIVFNNLNRYPFANHEDNRLAGGNNKECIEISKEVKLLSPKHQQPGNGGEMGDIKRALQSYKRNEIPLYLNPKTSSFIDVAVHAKVRQYLSDNTIIKSIRYARFMEMHKCPVDFRNLTPENVLDHFDYRIGIENATPHALAHEKKTIMMFLKAFGLKANELKTWSMVLKTPPITINDDISFVFPIEVHKFFTFEGFSNRKNYKLRIYENKLFQHIAFLGFNFGMRCPSEIISLTLDDVVINKDGSGYIRIHEMKKRGRLRKCYPHDIKVLNSLAYKTPLNYLKNWRYKVINDHSGEYFFLQPNGRPLTSKYVRDHLSKAGKEIIDNNSFRPYHMRHTFATYYYQKTKNLKKTANRLGHTKTANTDKYVDIAEELEQQYNGKNLFNIALKPHVFNTLGGKDIEQPTLSQREKKAQLKVNPSCCKSMGLSGFEPETSAV